MLSESQRGQFLLNFRYSLLFVPVSPLIHKRLIVKCACFGANKTILLPNTSRTILKTVKIFCSNEFPFRASERENLLLWKKKENLLKPAHSRSLFRSRLTLRIFKVSAHLWLSEYLARHSNDVATPKQRVRFVSFFTMFYPQCTFLITRIPNIHFSDTFCFFSTSSSSVIPSHGFRR